MSILNFSISGQSITATQYNGKARQFNILVDEPEALAGQDSAPNPVEYILAGYAGCLNVVIHLIAKELNVKINNLEINIEGDINLARFLGQSDDDRAGFKSLSVDIKLDSEAPAQVVDQLITQVKQRCPVNDNLVNATPVSYNFKHLVNEQLVVGLN
jgi:uncharacterized OsmC-like protein